MSRLTTERRKELPEEEFAGPGRTYPDPDIEHGRKAVQMAKHAGPAEARRIRAKVHRDYPSIKISGAK